MDEQVGSGSGVLMDWLRIPCRESAEVFVGGALDRRAGEQVDRAAEERLEFLLQGDYIQPVARACLERYEDVEVAAGPGFAARVTAEDFEFCHAIFGAYGGEAFAVYMQIVR